MGTVNSDARDAPDPTDSHRDAVGRDLPPDGTGRRRADLRLAAGLLLLTLLAYAPVVRNGFIWDDDQYLTRNVLVQRTETLPDVWRLRWDSEAGRFVIRTPQYYPLVFTSFWLEHKLWGLNPLPYHVVNVVLHALSAILLGLVLRRMCVPAAWVIAAAFALHPVQVETVAWITERKNTLSGVFFFAAFYAYLRFDASRGARWYLLAIAAFVLALLSKTVTAMLPVVLTITLLVRHRRVRLGDLLPTLPLWALGLAGGLLTASIERGVVGARGDAWGLAFWERAALVAPRAYLSYFQSVLWPQPLIFVYPRWEPSAADPLAYVPLALVVVLLALAVLLWRRHGPAVLALLVSAGALTFPALGFFNVYPHRFSWVADHFQYLGSAAFLAVVVLLVRALLRTCGANAGRVGLAVAALWLAALGVRTFVRTGAYLDARTLWEDTLRQNPGAWVAHLNLGNAAAAAKDLPGAQRHFELAAQSPAAVVDGYGAWANAMMGAKQPARALELSRLALERAPDSAKLHANHAIMLLANRDFAGAAAAAERAVELDPGLHRAWYTLGVVCVSQKRNEDAATALRRAIDLGLDSADAWRRYAAVLAGLGRSDEAETARRRAELLKLPEAAPRE